MACGFNAECSARVVLIGRAFRFTFALTTGVCATFWLLFRCRGCVLSHCLALVLVVRSCTVRARKAARSPRVAVIRRASSLTFARTTGLCAAFWQCFLAVLAV